MRKTYNPQYPPPILDIEASGFGNGSYPIEVGFIDSSAKRFCSLIQPLQGWIHWCASAEQAHGIPRDLLLQNGQCPRTVAQALNTQLQGKVVFSDGWVVDHPWLMKLFFAVNVEPTFQLSPIEMIMTERQIEIWDEVHDEVRANSTEQRHRASSDAFVIQQTWIKSHTLSK